MTVYDGCRGTNVYQIITTWKEVICLYQPATKVNFLSVARKKQIKVQFCTTNTRRINKTG